ncbi:MAG: hypothetical protein R2762_09495 [Bryobacteraceae bacterium]
MNKLLIAVLAGALMASPGFAFQRGRGGGKSSPPAAEKGGNKTGPRDGSGQKGNSKRGQGKKTGPQDGSGPIHDPPNR